MFLAFGKDVRAWIGATDHVNEGTFIWRDGTSAMGGGGVYTNWRAREPNNVEGKERCAEYRALTKEDERTGGWNDFPCEEKRGFYCQATIP